MVLLSLGYQEVAALPPRPQRFSTREHSCSSAAAASQTCQWENSPEGMAKLLVDVQVRRDPPQRQHRRHQRSRASAERRGPAVAFIPLPLRLLPASLRTFRETNPDDHGGVHTNLPIFAID